MKLANIKNIGTLPHILLKHRGKCVQRKSLLCARKQVYSNLSMLRSHDITRSENRSTQISACSDHMILLDQKTGLLKSQHVPIT